ncbi:fused MFS/spermidine synthase [Archangium violaceum]|uniref:spermidine synthase n=1 Tax=Archangium violaceum TaxID=83451 RepID=UPI00193AFFE1|nr:fused MFS/spermidine synthase [Archangium violaceum]QRK09642.1 fused MFS/spermidine synthase [Archangium violaceum]
MRRDARRLALVAVLVLLSWSVSGTRTVLYERESAYNHIVVSEDRGGRRYLQFEKGGALQSVVRPGHPLELELPYTRVAMVGLAFVPAPRRILVVGLGGGAMPMFLRALLPEAHIDVVDIDPDVVEVARRYFGFQEDPALRAHVADGRRFIESPGPAYDLILLDAYGARSIPKHLVTREFLAAVRARLTGAGAVVSNVWEQRSNPLFDSMVRTYQEGFVQLYTFQVPSSDNRILVGLPHSVKPSREALEARAERLERERGVPFDLSALVVRGYEDATDRPARGQELVDPAGSP